MRYKDRSMHGSKGKYKVLVLNSDYHPINICSVRRAFNLILKGNAELVHDHKDNPIVSGAYTFPRPSIIRIKTYVHLPYRKINISKYNVFKRDGFKCLYCGEAGSGKVQLTLDHVIPKSKGGLSTWDNLATACSPCNRKKGDRSVAEAGYTLAYKPYKPNILVFLRDFNGVDDPAWKKYLYFSD